MVAVRRDYAAPPGLKFVLVLVLQIYRATGAGEKRWRATAVQDAGANDEAARRTRSVLECASPLALGNAATLG
jgi:hypothetical protein